jgi:hypothetical protein
MLVGGAVERRRGFPIPGAAPLRGAGQSALCVPPQRPAVENPGSGRRAGGRPLALGWAGGAVRSLQRRYDMNGRFQMQGGKNSILPKYINANRFFWDSLWLEIWSNHFCPLWNRMEGAWLWTQGFSRNVDTLLGLSSNCRVKYSEHLYMSARPVANSRDSLIQNTLLHLLSLKNFISRDYSFHGIDSQGGLSIFKILYIENLKLTLTFCNTLGFIKIQCSKFLFAYGKCV